MDLEKEQSLHGGNRLAEADQIYDNIFKVIEVAGGRPANVIKTVEYLTIWGVEDYKRISEVREKLLAEPYPVTTTVACDKLVRRELQLEVVPFAILD